VPALVQCVLGLTGAPQLAYVGFSQGTAQMFAALATNRALQSRIALFCALSPAARATGLTKSVLTTLVETNLRFINLLFGRSRMLPITLLWQRIVSRARFVKMVDCAMWYLFSWTNSQVRCVCSCCMLLQHTVLSYTACVCAVNS
jgi:lysosomal acid lipase/cholesteryl ester hydrolase